MQNAVVTFDIEPVEAKELEQIEEAKGKLSMDLTEDKLMKSVLQNDKKKVDQGKIINEAINQGIGSFTPDTLYEQLVKNYMMAKKVFGPKLLKLLTGYDPSYIDKNIKIPEFQRKVFENIKGNIEDMKFEDFLDKDGHLNEKGIELGALILYTEELDKMVAKGILGERVHKKSFIYGEKGDVKNYSKGDRYKDLALKKSVKTAIRRGHSGFIPEDLKTFTRQSKGKICVIYGLDASGSMKGEKLDICKKAGVALAFKALNEHDKVGLIVFGSEIKEFIHPTDDFSTLLKAMTKIRASKQTNILKTIEKAIELFPHEKITKHLILITDAMPTIGKDPEKETIEAVAEARAADITISLIGIGLDKKGRELAEKITEIGSGNLYMVRNLENIDKIVLEDYYSVI